MGEGAREGRRGRRLPSEWENKGHAALRTSHVVANNPVFFFLNFESDGIYVTMREPTYVHVYRCNDGPIFIRNYLVLAPQLSEWLSAPEASLVPSAQTRLEQALALV